MTIAPLRDAVPPRSSGTSRPTTATSVVVRRPTRGFTLVEALITVAIVSILASIALPAYTDYITRSKLVEATTSLSDMRVRLEQYLPRHSPIPDVVHRSGGGSRSCGADLSAVRQQVLHGHLRADGNHLHGYRHRERFAESWAVLSTRSIRATTGRQPACRAAGRARVPRAPVGSTGKTEIVDMATPTFARGFTLLELMVALVIAALLLSLGMPSFTTFLRNSEIRSTAESISNGLRAARTEATRLNKPVSFTLVGGGDPSWAINEFDPATTTLIQPPLQRYAKAEAGSDCAGGDHACQRGCRHVQWPGTRHFPVVDRHAESPADQRRFAGRGRSAHLARLRRRRTRDPDLRSRPGNRGAGAG